MHDEPNPTSPDREAVNSTLLTLQIITGALAFGATTFAAVAYFVVTQRGDGGEIGQKLGLIGVGIGLMKVVASFLVPGLFVRQQLRALEAPTEADLCGVFRSQHIVRIALLEGAAFFNLVMYIAGTQWWSLAFAGGLVAWIIAQVPTRTRLTQWIETQQINRI